MRENSNLQNGQNNSVRSREAIVRKINQEGDDLVQDPLTIKATNKWLKIAAKQPDPVRIFGPLLHEQELAILFADQKSGKSALAVQIGNACAAGEHIQGFANNAKPGPVLYMDFELSSKQFELRYNDPDHELKQFSHNFYRAEINREQLSENFSEAILQRIEEEAKQYKLIIIDNLTYLLTDQEKSAKSGQFIQRLSALKKDTGAAILLIAHTPKRSPTEPITANDLAGSHMLTALADSIFALGKNASEPELRYVKQINSRSEPEEEMGADNVATLHFQKHGNFLSFDFQGYGREAYHLKTDTEEEKEELAAEVCDLKQKGYSIREIADDRNISRAKADRLSRGS
jgi:RecA-family ATPase